MTTPIGSIKFGGAPPDYRKRLEVFEQENTAQARMIERLEAELTEAQRTIKRVRNGIKSVRELIDNSRGVDGLHMNGDIAYWDELEGGGKFEEWLAPFNVAEAALGEEENG